VVYGVSHFFLWAALLVRPGPAAAEPAPSQPAPACLYESRSYSDGAFICVQKSLMLTCSSDGTRATWKMVANRDINERCTVPTVLSFPPVQRRHARRTRKLRHRESAPREASAKCFSFNGKQYCE
jgi:hypothetical protein